MHIAFDCDGVLRDFQTNAINLFLSENPEYEEYFKKPLRWDGWSPRTTLKDSNEEIYSEFTDFLFEDPETSYKAYRTADPFDEVSEFSRYYKMLKKIGCQVSICTSQGSSWQRVAAVQWVDENISEFDNVVLCGSESEGKGSFDFDYLLDDKWQNVADVDKQGGRGVLLKRNWNTHRLNRVKRAVDDIEEFVKMVISEKV